MVRVAHKPGSPNSVNEGLLCSNATDPDPFPYAPDQEGSDPILESGMAQITQAMVNFATSRGFSP